MFDVELIDCTSAAARRRRFGLSEWMETGPQPGRRSNYIRPRKGSDAGHAPDSTLVYNAGGSRLDEAWPS